MENINENNRLIAYSDFAPDDVKVNIEHYTDNGSNDGLRLYLGSLDFHKNYSSLMPVVEKICKYKFEDGDTAYPRTFGMLDENGHYMVRFNRFQLFTAPTLIEAIYTAVLTFIKEIKSLNPVTNKKQLKYMSKEQLITEIEKMQANTRVLGQVWINKHLPFAVSEFETIMKPIILIENACIEAVQYLKQQSTSTN